MSNRETHARGLLDTSVAVDLHALSLDELPAESVMSTLTLAELTSGPHATNNSNERARRQEQLQRIESAIGLVPFGVNAARSYGRIYARVAASGRKARGAQAVNLMIAATALAEGLPLFTRNPKDFAALGDLIEVVTV